MGHWNNKSFEFLIEKIRYINFLLRKSQGSSNISRVVAFAARHRPLRCYVAENEKQTGLHALCVHIGDATAMWRIRSTMVQRAWSAIMPDLCHVWLSFRHGRSTHQNVGKHGTPAQLYRPAPNTNNLLSVSLGSKLASVVCTLLCCCKDYLACTL